MPEKALYIPTLNRELTTKHAGGRPTLYNEALLDKAYQYLESLSDPKSGLPSHVNLALYLGINTDTLYSWIKDKNKQEFSDICKTIKDLQHSSLVGNGLTGAFNAHITKVMLTKHGYTDNANNNNNIQIVVSRDGVEVNQEKVIDHE